MVPAAVKIRFNHHHQELKDMKGTWAAFDEHKKHPERYGYGYLNAIPAQHSALIGMYRP